AHGQAEMMELNYLIERGAVTREATGRYAIDYDKMAVAMNDLAKELLEMEATGDRQRVENWFAKYDKMSDEMKTGLQKKTADIPGDGVRVYVLKNVVRTRGGGGGPPAARRRGLAKSRRGARRSKTPTLQIPPWQQLE